ncbi:hypothetical protein F4778DRAFT_783370 [Xylariomycetidae sp. FL2044]|nr:hypothetical protein F4778DRAFT_783370 [Xylariomycetidae sp. FL2044]
MAAADSLPSSQSIVPGSIDIPLATWPLATEDSETVDAIAVAGDVVDALNKSIEKKDYKSTADLFLEDGYWRDHLSMTWDLRTIKGREKITDFLERGHHLTKVDIDRSASHRGPQVISMRSDGSIKPVQFFIIVTTKYGSGRGLARLVNQSGQWKIWTLFTTLEEIDGHEEPLGPNRTNGVEHGPVAGRKNWLERRYDEVNFEGADPDVLIIGCGQAGLSVHARLKMLNVPTLIIDQSDNIGDSWEKRYHQLVLHDPVCYDHMPYIEFPKSWPVFTPKDKLAAFLKTYAEMLELNVWNNTSLESSEWDGSKKQWIVRLARKHKDGSTETRVMRPKHIIQATGHSGEKNYPRFRGMDNFKGDVLCHSSEFHGAKHDTKGRRAVVIGSSNSALDISQDYYENGYDVTLVQRSTTTVINIKTIQEITLGTIYREGGLPVEDADVLSWCMPGELAKAVNADLVTMQQDLEREAIDGLNKAGFKIDYGPMNGGLMSKYLQRGGGYYIDVGTSQLIIEGKIKVKHGVEVQEILPYGVRFADGTELEADEIVCATGYQNMRTATELIFGAEVASKVGNVWGLDEEGETKVMWRRSGHPNLWLHGGVLALCRYFSRLLALQIVAQLDGKSAA